MRYVQNDGGGFARSPCSASTAFEVREAMVDAVELECDKAGCDWIVDPAVAVSLADPLASPVMVSEM